MRGSHLSYVYKVIRRKLAFHQAADGKLEETRHGTRGQIFQQSRSPIGKQSTALEAFQKSGVTETTELQLEFLYYSPSAEDAAGLKTLLEEYGYAVTVRPTGSILKRQWLVEGKTVKTTLDLEKLNQWTEWMVLAGEEHHSDFDGCGASFPDSG